MVRLIVSSGTGAVLFDVLWLLSIERRQTIACVLRGVQEFAELGVDCLRISVLGALGSSRKPRRMPTVGR